MRSGSNRFETIVDLLWERAGGRPVGVPFQFLMDGERFVQKIGYRDLDLRGRAIGAWLLANVATPGRLVLLLYPPCQDAQAMAGSCPWLTGPG